MPILQREDDIYPLDLLDDEQVLGVETRQRWCIYTLSRREKDLMRRLVGMEIPFYAPIIEKRYRSPAGRLRTSFVPLFPNYVFLFASDEERHRAMTTNCISRCSEVTDHKQLVIDLRQLYHVVQSGVPLTPESKLIPGDHVRVRSGPFKNYEGTVVRREGRTRLLLTINFLEQGVSMEVDEGLLEPA